MNITKASGRFEGNNDRTYRSKGMDDNHKRNTVNRSCIDMHGRFILSHGEGRDTPFRIPPDILASRSKRLQISNRADLIQPAF
jgi:hypothetical protein